MKIFSKALFAGVALLALPASANAAVVALNFEGVNATYPSGYANVLGFYNGGTSSDGTSGTNFGIEFSRNALAICLNSTTVRCSNTSRGGIGDPNSQKGGLFFLSGNETFMNVAAGFDTGFSFNYVSFNQPGSVSVFDGLNGAGNLLATISLSPNAGNCPGYSAGFCPFSAAGITFAGTAKSVSFAGVADQIVFDDVTFGSSTPGGVPEPAAWAMMLAGFGLVGGAMRRRQKVAVTFA